MDLGIGVGCKYIKYWIKKILVSKIREHDKTLIYLDRFIVSRVNYVYKAS